jgi:hypothetical protein
MNTTLNKELLRARARGYRLLGRLLLEGARPELLAELGGTYGEDEAEALDDIAARHHRLLEVEVLPYATVFLEPGSQAGGQAAEVAQQICAELDVPRATLNVSDDHIGALLVLLGRLDECVLRAVDLDDDELLHRVRRAQVRLLDEAVLSWMVVLRAALRRERGLWPELLATAHDLAREQRRELEATPVPAPELPEPPALLDDEGTRLRDFARFALTPCWSGVFFLRSGLTRLARGQDLPTGFGSREQVLEGLFRSASEYGDPAAVFRAMAAAFEDEAAALMARAKGVDSEVGRAFAERARATQRMLEEAARRADEARAA